MYTLNKVTGEIRTWRRDETIFPLLITDYGSAMQPTLKEER